VSDFPYVLNEEITMTNVEKAKTDPIGQLWDQIDSVHTVMLGSPNHAHHMQPMAPQSARDEQAIWFFTKNSSDIAHQAAAGGAVHMCLLKDDYQACLAGDLQTVPSPEHVDRYWSSIVEAWYPGGKKDPDLTMLRFVPKSAEIWASTGSTLKFGWEIAKANLTNSEPDVGYKTEIVF